MRARFAILALGVTLGLIFGVSPAALAEEGPASTPTAPRFELVPAFADDLPISEGSYGPSGTTTSTASTAGSWVCTVYASDPSKFANTIDGEGFQSCSGVGWSPQRITVTIQRYCCFGFWNNRASIDSGYVYVNFVQRDRIYDCTGTGSQLYRVVTGGYAAGGSAFQPVQSANYLRATC